MSKRKCDNSLVSTQPLSKADIKKAGCLVILPDKRHKTHGNTKSVAWTYFGKLFYNKKLETTAENAIKGTNSATSTATSLTITPLAARTENADLIPIDVDNVYCTKCLEREQ